MNEWVIFLTALFRAAERLSLEMADPDIPIPYKLVSEILGKYEDPLKRYYALDEARKYAHILRQKRRSLKQLFDLLELPLANRTYWWIRAQRMQAEVANNWADKSQSTCDDVNCPYKPIRDCEGWEKGELDNAPWDGADEDCEWEEDVDMESEEEEEDDDDDESVPMEIESDSEMAEPEQLIPQSIAKPALSLIIDDDESEGEPMEIDSEMPSPVTPEAVIHARLARNVMSIADLLNNHTNLTVKTDGEK